MQVKKFEARTMKEALEMVKTQLGPDAIILSARDNKKSYGLVGEGSVEITAAVSEETLHRKKFTESRLKVEDKERLQKSSARVQKQVIEKMVSTYSDEKNRGERPAITQRRYIDIDDEQMLEAGQSTPAGQRIRSAAERAWNTMQSTGAWSPPAAQAAVSQATVSGAVSQASANTHLAESVEIKALKGEIANLKQVISGFQTVPQSMTGSHPGADYGLTYEVTHMFEKLTAAGVTSEIAAQILNLAQENMSPTRLKNKALVDAWVAKFILESTIISREKNLAKMQVFVGPSGTGKTATLIKLASHLVVKENKRVAILTTDTFKVGAGEQLKIYAQILNVPFASIRSKEDWVSVAPALAKYDHVLVDFPGVSLKSVNEISQVKSLLPPDEMGTQIHLVLSSLAKDSDLSEIGRRFKVLNYKDVIFTSLDESVQHGNIYNFMRRFEVPLHSFGIGSRVPEDFEVATKERLLDLIFKLTKVKKEQV